MVEMAATSRALVEWCGFEAGSFLEAWEESALEYAAGEGDCCPVACLQGALWCRLLGDKVHALAYVPRGGRPDTLLSVGELLDKRQPWPSGWMTSNELYRAKGKTRKQEAAEAAGADFLDLAAGLVVWTNDPVERKPVMLGMCDGVEGNRVLVRLLPGDQAQWYGPGDGLVWRTVKGRFQAEALKYWQQGKVRFPFYTAMCQRFGANLRWADGTHGLLKRRKAKSD